MSPLKIFVSTAILVFLVSLLYWLGLFQNRSPKTLSPKIGDKTTATSPLVPTSENDLEEYLGEVTPKAVDRTVAALIENVPFTVQAPFSEWSDPRFQDACEEASILMAMKWLEGKNISSRAEAKAEILALVDWQIKNYENYHDTSAEDTMERLFQKYYHYENVWITKEASDLDIISELQKGNLVIAPMNGQLLNNPSFTQPGPERHMVVIKGFDPVKDEFITNDPGISQGENYRYPISLFINAIRDYPTGYHSPITTLEKTIIVISKTPPPNLRP